MLMPDRETIHKLLKGELPPEDAGAVFRQLEDELAFDSFVAAFADDRTFLDLLRNASVLLTQAPNPELDRLVRRFRASGALTAPNGTLAGSGKPPRSRRGRSFGPSRSADSGFWACWAKAVWGRCISPRIRTSSGKWL